MIEKTPIFNVTKETFDLLLDNDLKPLFNKINTEYLYWDKVKYLAPKGVRPEDQGDRNFYTRFYVPEKVCK